MLAIALEVDIINTRLGIDPVKVSLSHIVNVCIFISIGKGQIPRSIISSTI